MSSSQRLYHAVFQRVCQGRPRERVTRTRLADHLLVSR